MSDVRIEGLNKENTLALAARLRERADGLPQDAEDRPVIGLRGEALHVMEFFDSNYECGTVGCIMGEFAIWKPHEHFCDFIVDSGAYDIDDFDLDAIIYLERWKSDDHHSRFLATPLLAERLRIMASYLTWLAGEEA